MPVEITILSGQRQGERIELADSAFEVGDLPTDAVHFDAATDPEITGHRASLRLEDGGWRIRSTGALPIILNHDPIERPHALRSGDIVRMSENGPDFSFALINRLSPSPKVNPVAAAPATSAPRPTAASSASDQSLESEPRSTKLSTAAIATVLVTVCVALFAVIFMRPGGSDVKTSQPPSLAPAPDSSVDEGQELLSVPKVHNGEGLAGPSFSLPAESPAGMQIDRETVEPGVTAVNPDQWEIAADQVRQSLYLVGVQPPDSQTMLPLGTACAIDADTLLTSATVAAGLEEGRRREWKVVAVNATKLHDFQAGLLEITDLKAHIGWVKSEDPETQLFFDLGLLKVAGSFETSCQLATAESLAELAAQPQSLGCLGFELTGGPLTRFDPPTAELKRVELYSVIALPDADGAAADAPPLLQLSGELPANPFGSPIFTRDGKVVGVYAVRASLPADAEPQHIHYAPVVTLVSAWLAGEGQNHWIKPEPAPTPPPSNESN